MQIEQIFPAPSVSFLRLKFHLIKLEFSIPFIIIIIIKSADIRAFVADSHVSSTNRNGIIYTHDQSGARNGFLYACDVYCACDDGIRIDAA